MLTALFGSLIGKLSAMGLATKAAVGLGAAATATAGIAVAAPDVLPVGGSGNAAVQVTVPVTVPPVTLPDVAVVPDVTLPELPALRTLPDLPELPVDVPLPTLPSLAGVVPQVTLPDLPPAAAAGQAGLDVAAQAGPPADPGRPGSAGHPGQSGLEKAAQTPAADHLPTNPGPPADVPPASASAGIDRALQTPAADRIPGFVKGGR